MTSTVLWRSTVILAGLFIASPAQAERIQNPIAIFNGLDKITGITTRFEVKVKEQATFGGLRVKPFVCYTRPVTEAPKTTSFVQVEELPATGEAEASTEAGKRIFSGWMFAESPGLNAVEHPIFDVWLVGCLDPNAPPPPVETPVIAGKKPGEEQSESESGDTGTESEEQQGTGPTDPAPNAVPEITPEPSPAPEATPETKPETQSED
jgi:hypothetical protein